MPQRLPIVNSDDGTWGDILRQYLMKEHYDDGTDNAANGGHQKITVRAGTATAGTAPLKFTSGTLLTTPEAGAIEFNSDKLYFTKTTGPTRQTVATYDTTGSTGDIYYRDASSNFVALGIGGTNAVLNVTGGVPAWTTSPSLSSPTLSTPVITGTPTGTGVATAATASTLALRDANANLTADAFIATAASTPTAATTTTLDINSAQTQIFTGTTTQNVNLPTTSVVAGQTYTIVNQSTGAVTVRSSGANNILTLAANATGVFTAVVATPTTAAHWVATATVADKSLTVNNDLTLAGTDGKTLTVNNTLTLSGTDSTTMTFPSTNATIARTDAAQTFTGVQTFSNAPSFGALPTGSGVASAATASTLAARDANANLTADNFISTATSTATSATTTALDINSAQTQVFTGTTTQTVTLPTTSIVVGMSYTIVNQSTGAVTVQSSGANTVATLAANTSGRFTAVVATPTTAAHWIGDIKAAGSASADGDASTNTTTSVDGEVVLFNGTTGKSLKRATGTGLAKLTSGVLSTATAGTDYVTPSGTETISGKTLTAPRIANAGYIADANGNEQIIFNTTASAVNEISITNAATTGKPTIAATGGDADVTLNLTSKGSGTVQANGVDVVTTSASQTITSKTISGSSNTLSNIGLSSLSTTGTANSTTYLRGDGQWTAISAGMTRTFTTTSGSYTAGSTANTDYIYIIAGAHAGTLPAASGNTSRYTFKNTHTADVTLTRAGTDTIEGSTSITLSPSSSIDLVSNGTNTWIII